MSASHADEVIEALVVEVRRAVEDCPHSRAEVARRVGMARSTLARRLSGEHTFYVEELEQLGNVLGVKLSDLMHRAEDAAAR